MQQYKYLYTKRAATQIRSFYKNVAKKYCHTYSYEDMERNVRDAFFAIYAIECSLPRRKPTLSRWTGYHIYSLFQLYVFPSEVVNVVSCCF